MKRLHSLLPALLFPGLAAVAVLPLIAQDKQPNAPAPAYENTFEDLEEGPAPDDYFILGGSFAVATVDGSKVLQVLPDPLEEASVQLGSSVKGSGRIKARVKAERRGRSYPRFGVGLHGLSGFRLRVVPAGKEIELAKGEEVVTSAPFEWRSGEWYFVELSVLENGPNWTVSGKVWPESDEEPANAQIEYIAEAEMFSGKGSVLGTPYSGTPISFDDLKITPVPGAGSATAPTVKPDAADDAE